MTRKVLAVLVVLAFAVGTAAMVAPLSFLRPAPRRPVAAHAPAPTRVRIAAIGLDAPVEPETATRAGAMILPGDVARVGWYSLGVRPGQPGDAVIAGRVDGSGPAVLARLGQVHAGSRIEVDMTDGGTLTFAVASAKSYAAGRQPDGLFARGGTPRLSLIAAGRTSLVVEAILRPTR